MLCLTLTLDIPLTAVLCSTLCSQGTVAIANKLAQLTPKGCITIIGGGDSVAAVEQAGVAEKMSHISTGE